MILHIAQGGIVMASGIGQFGQGVLQQDIGLLIAGFVVAMLGVFWMKAATGLASGRESTRALFVFLSVLGLLSFPVGTVLHGAALRFLVKTKDRFR